MAGKQAASASRRTKPLRARKSARLKSLTPATRAAPAAKSSPAVAAASPLAPKNFAMLPPIAGVRLATGAAGIRYRNRADTMLAVLAAGTQVAGLFTTSRTASAPVEWCRTQLPRKSARALVANSEIGRASGRERVKVTVGAV